jgi:hypothetical protein
MRATFFLFSSELAVFSSVFYSPSGLLVIVSIGKSSPPRDSHNLLDFIYLDEELVTPVIKFCS